MGELWFLVQNIRDKLNETLKSRTSSHLKDAQRSKAEAKNEQQIWENEEK